MSAQIDLSCYDNSWFRPGRSFFVRALWMFAGQPVFALSFLPFSSLRVFLLRMFGADVGHRGRYSLRGAGQVSLASRNW